MSAETMEGRAEPIKLRPHHLKTLWTYMLDKQPINPEEMDKEGYGQGFTDAMYSLFDRIIQEPLTFVEIVPSLDSICANCKRDREKSKCYLKDEDKYFGKNATDVMEHIGCRVGETYHAGDLINRIEKCLLDASVWFRKGFKKQRWAGELSDRKL